MQKTKCGKKYEKMTKKCIKNRDLITEVGNLESHGNCCICYWGYWGTLAEKSIKKNKNQGTQNACRTTKNKREPENNAYNWINKIKHIATLVYV